jgi:D-inositol-3-phosphate glycosyltransferase
VTQRPRPTGRPVRRVAVVSIHSSPIAPPGAGDSGGMNVWVRAVASELARRNVASDLYTRADDPDLPRELELEPGVRLIHLPAGPQAPVDKEALPGYLAAFLCSLLHTRHGDDSVAYDLIHSHYWLSGWVARLARERWQVPYVHSFHTLGRVKNATIDPGEEAEPAVRLAGEERVATSADRLIVPTSLEAAQLVELYGAPAGRIEVIGPGVDGSLFHPGDRSAARAALAAGPLASSSLGPRLASGDDGRPPRLLAFVGRLQTLKGPEVAVQALAELRRREPELDTELLVVGGPSGSDRREPERLGKLAATLGRADRVHLLPVQPHDTLADVYRAADLLLVPSRSESFGLVALEAQACGTPVLATRVGGLGDAVGDGTTGLLLPDRDPATWADAAGWLLGNPRKLAAMRAAAAQFSRAHTWRETADRLLGLYTGLVTEADPAMLERTS